MTFTTRLLSLFAGAAGVALLSGCVSADAPKDLSKFGVGLGVGTTGATIEAKYAPSAAVQLRGNFNYLDFGADADFDGIDYDGDFKANTFGGFVDLAPFKNGFHISGGAYVGDKTLDLNATPTSDIEIGDQIFTSEQVGTLTGKAELANVAPYLGVGYDGFLRGMKDWTFNARAGVMFTGSPDAELVSANGLLSSDPRLRAELDAEVQALEDEADGYKYYPVVTLGVTRRF